MEHFVYAALIGLGMLLGLVGSLAVGPHDPNPSIDTAITAAYQQPEAATRAVCLVEDLLTHAPIDGQGAIWADLAGAKRQYEHEAAIYNSFVLEHYGDIVDVESGDRVDVTPLRAPTLEQAKELHC